MVEKCVDLNTKNIKKNIYKKTPADWLVFFCVVCVIMNFFLCPLFRSKQVFDIGGEVLQFF